MPLDSRNGSRKVSEESLGSLNGCLVEGDPEQRRRERRVRRRALVISILMQSAALALLILIPLFGKTERIAVAITTPIPPYSSYRGPSHDGSGRHSHGRQRNIFHFSVPHQIPPIIVTHHRPTDDESDDAPLVGSGQGIPGALDGIIPIPEARATVPPERDEHRVTPPAVLRMTHLDPAMLIYRVDPVYPALPKQIHKEGRVELRAIIAIDGSIRSLEVVGGDPMFFQSALDAVSQWHYKPTILNGHAVEVDTHITVIYTMPH
ncbi:MAG TPA: energy transducer TonB [Candidatus Dormibacteraeota bacterium]|nr:energy transducer TonB [Candidatus Dormibacteraeota bacterium]